MISTILALDDVQGDLIRRLTRQAVSPASYAQAHGLFLERQPGRPRPHRSALALPMEVNHGRWVGLCPECRAGVTTGKRWPEARCFGCGAIFDQVLWPEALEALEALLLERLPKNRHWKTGESLEQLLADNIAHGVRKAR
jgi:hypothetical protein